MKKYFLTSFTILTCLPAMLVAADDSPIERALAADIPAIRHVAEDLDRYQVQILFTEVHRDSDNAVTFEEYSFRVDDNHYFYPASTVKFPVAMLALEKLEELGGFSRDARYTVGDDETEYTFADDVTQIFVVSDDAAYNRLFEFLGKDEINFRLQRKQLDVRISHRLSIPNSDLLPTQRIEITSGSGSRQVIGPIDNSPIEILPLQNLTQGIAYMESGERISTPFDFSEKNYLPLTSLHGIMKRIIFPEMFPERERFHLSVSNREFVLRSMRTLPRQVGYPEDEYPDGRLKYLVHGDSTERFPDNLQIFNKIGQAYGYLTDTAYIVEEESNREFLITATIHVNANQTFNDDNYEYEEIGIPFLAELGRQLIKGE